jgi:drug/metabolite transporter (DMT)-like permease
VLSALEASANVTMITAIRFGPLAVASVLGSLYPVVTILLARVVLHERVRALQRLGIGLALVAVVLTAVR